MEDFSDFFFDDGCADTNSISASTESIKSETLLMKSSNHFWTLRFVVCERDNADHQLKYVPVFTAANAPKRHRPLQRRLACRAHTPQRQPRTYRRSAALRSR